MTTCIRFATSLDRDDIREIYLRAFPASESPLVASLAADLLSDETRPQTISLIAEIGGEVVGHIAFSPVTADGKRNWSGYILAPLAVEPEYQNRGIGSKLVESGIEQFSGKRVDILFVYGDPKYYERFGFSADAATKYLPPYKLQYPSGWQALALHEGEANEQSINLSCIASLRDPALW